MLPGVQSLVTTFRVCHALVYVMSYALSMLLLIVHLLFYAPNFLSLPCPLACSLS
jgi:hypothetical protein